MPSLLCALVALAAALPSLGAQRPVVVYSLDFEARRARDVDLAFFDGGYFAGPALGGIGTFIFTIDDGPGERFYTIAPSAGRIFTVFSETGQRTVISTADAFETGFSSYLFTGNKDHTVRIPGFSFDIARALEGTCLAARDESAFGERAAPGGEAAGIIGLRANFQNGFTLRANRRGGHGVLEAVNLLTATLEQYGFVNLDSTNPPEDDSKTLSAQRRADFPEGRREMVRVDIIKNFFPATGDPGANDDRLLYSIWLKALRHQHREQSGHELP